MAQTKKTYLDYNGLQYLVQNYILSGGNYKNALTSRIDYIDFKLTTLSSDPWGDSTNEEFFYGEMVYGYLWSSSIHPDSADYLSQSSRIVLGTVLIPRVAKDNFLKLDSANIDNGILQLYLTSAGYINGGTDDPALITVDLNEYFDPNNYYTATYLDKNFITPDAMSSIYISTNDAADTYLTPSEVDEMVISADEIEVLFPV